MRFSGWSSDVCSSDLTPALKHPLSGFFAERPIVTLMTFVYLIAGLVLRARAGAAAMFANLSNAAQQITGCSIAAEIGRGSGRERVCQDVKSAGGAGASKKKQNTQSNVV